jgi:EmrB/QacA subfamily drug resistance transporter
LSQTVEAKSTGENGGFWMTLLAIILGTFVAVLNNSLINVALPKLVNVFGSTTQDIQWVLTGYMLASAVVIPMSGSLGDKYGYKKMFLLSLIAFTIGSLLCGLAWSDTSLIVFRIFQGVSGGFIMPIGMAMIYMIVPRQQIGMALGLWGIAAMVAPAIGPTLSGYLIEYFSWRILFFINIPVGVFAVLACGMLLKETPKKPELSFDMPGAVLSIIAFGTLLLALTKGQSEGWDSLFIISMFFISFFSMVLLVWVELGKEQPLLDFRLFKIPVFSISILTSGMVMMGMFGGVFLTPIYLQNIQGLSAVDTGILLMPQSIAMALMMPISGKLFDKFGVGPIGVVGLTLMGVTTYELHRLTVDTSNHWLDMVLTIRGLGIGLCMMPLTTVGMNAVPKQVVGRASSLSNVLRQVMGSLGIAVLTAIMTHQQTLHSAVIAESVSMTSPAALQAISELGALFAQGGIDVTSAQGVSLTVIAGLVQKEAAVRAIADTFLVSALPILASIPLVYFLRKQRKEAQAEKT